MTGLLSLFQHLHFSYCKIRAIISSRSMKNSGTINTRGKNIIPIKMMITLLTCRHIIGGKTGTFTKSKQSFVLRLEILKLKVQKEQSTKAPKYHSKLKQSKPLERDNTFYKLKNDKV